MEDEKLDGIEIEDVLNLEKLPGTVFIDQECWNLKVVVDGGELTRDINRKNKPDVLQVYECPLCDISYRRDSFFNKHVKYSESGKHEFS